MVTVVEKTNHHDKNVIRAEGNLKQRIFVSASTQITGSERI